LAGDVVITGNVSAASVGLQGWCIQLLQNGVAVSGAVTDAAGNYSLTGVSNVAYVVCAVIQPTWIQTYPTPVFASGICPSGVSGYAMNLPPGGSSPFNDFVFSH
jgi:hypothetical protein